MSGEPGDAFSCGGPVTRDGRSVLFTSLARDLVDDDNIWWSLYVRDVATGTISRVAVTTGEGPEPEPGFYDVALSGDGRHVAFSYYASFVDAGGRDAGVEGIEAHPDGVLEAFAHTFAVPYKAP